MLRARFDGHVAAAGTAGRVVVVVDRAAVVVGATVVVVVVVACTVVAVVEGDDVVVTFLAVDTCVPAEAQPASSARATARPVFLTYVRPPTLPSLRGG